ncbi:unnamed protein product, partial [Closterium sp. NIES-65]
AAKEPKPQGNQSGANAASPLTYPLTRPPLPSPLTRSSCPCLPHTNPCSQGARANVSHVLHVSHVCLMQPSAGSAGAAAADARNKLVERGEKISKLNDMADELEADTAEFSDLAAQLKKKMEKRWW